MDINNMRNIVILKNLPSNLVEEAFVVLKDNQKIRKMEYAESKFDGDEFCNCEYRENEDDYIIKEAELLVSNYIDKLENKDIDYSENKVKLERKCKKLKKIIYILSCIIVVSIAYIIKI